MKVTAHAVGEFTPMKFFSAHGNQVQVWVNGKPNITFFATTDALVDFLERTLDECRQIQSEQRSGKG
jgi:nitrous oxide reductase accessory protein NosL